MCNSISYETHRRIYRIRHIKHESKINFKKIEKYIITPKQPSLPAVIQKFKFFINQPSNQNSKNQLKKDSYQHCSCSPWRWTSSVHSNQSHGNDFQRKNVLTNQVLIANYLYVVHDSDKKKKILIYFVTRLVGPFSDLMTNAKFHFPDCYKAHGITCPFHLETEKDQQGKWVQKLPLTFLQVKYQVL